MASRWLCSHSLTTASRPGALALPACSHHPTPPPPPGRRQMQVPTSCKVLRQGAGAATKRSPAHRLTVPRLKAPPSERLHQRMHGGDAGTTTCGCSLLPRVHDPVAAAAAAGWASRPVARRTAASYDTSCLALGHSHVQGFPCEAGTLPSKQARGTVQRAGESGPRDTAHMTRPTVPATDECWWQPC